MRIGEMADALGISTDTVRFYERAGWLPRPERAENGYRQYRTQDVEHLRLMLDLRRMDLPLDAAARLAAWCHSGHCEATSTELPQQIAEKRAEIARRVEDLSLLDRRLADLERHLASSPGALTELVADRGPCCSAAMAVVETAEGSCACCRTAVLGE